MKTTEIYGGCAARFKRLMNEFNVFSKANYGANLYFKSTGHPNLKHAYSL